LLDISIERDFVAPPSV